MVTVEQVMTQIQNHPETITYFEESSKSLPDGAGTLKTVSQFYRKNGSDRFGLKRNINILVDPLGNAFILGAGFENSTIVPRVSKTQVLEFYPDAKNINITRESDEFDRVVFEDYDVTNKTAIRRTVMVQFDGETYQTHYEVTNLQ